MDVDRLELVVGGDPGSRVRELPDLKTHIERVFPRAKTEVPKLRIPHAVEHKNGALLGPIPAEDHGVQLSDCAAEP